MTEELRDDAYAICLDDDPMICRILAQITRTKTLPFVSGRKLLEKAAGFQPAVAYVDIHLGTDESGLDVLPDLRTIWPHTPLIAMTADEDPELIGRSLSLGANDFLRKPLVPAEVSGRVLARMAEMAQRSASECVKLSNLLADRSQRSLTGPRGKRFLSDTEWHLFHALLNAQSLFVGKADLKAMVWGGLAISDNAVDRKLTAVRRALKDVGARVRVTSKYGVGVRLEVSKHE